MRYEGGRERLQRRGNPYTPAGHWPACQSGERRQQQVQLTDAEPGDEDFHEPGTRPAAPGQTLIERAEACGNDLRPRGAAAAPDGRMLEQPSQFGVGGHENLAAR